MERIKAYLEEQIKTDPALAEAYSESKLKDCWNYIISQARKQAKNNCAMVEDAVVYKWARDYMLGDVPEAKKEETKPAVELPASEPEEGNSPAEDDVEPIQVATPEDIAELSETALPGKEIAEGTYEITPDLHFNDTHQCKECGYFYQNNCQLKSEATEENHIACNNFIKAATEEDIKPIQEKLKIEKVIEDAPAAPEEEIKPVIAKEKKSKKKVEEYDGPSLFDFDNLY